MTAHHPANTEQKPDLEQKRRALYDRLRRLGRLTVAYSGGTDSAYLAWSAHQVLGREMLAVIADSPSLARADLKCAVDFAATHSIPLRIVQTNELADPDYVRNNGDRCFHCKDELFQVMTALCNSTTNGMNLAYGMNVDDTGDFRPGQKAAAQHNVLAPLAEAGLTKAEIRELARQADLSIWDRPAAACLSSRIAYGLPVTPETLDRIEQGEAFLASLGLRQFRVRHHGEIARVEIARAEMEQIFSLTIFDQISTTFKSLGYKFITLDLEGFRSGSMNTLLPASTIGWNHPDPDPVVPETTR
jgi:pyridinium-3,5-biscarboxylic acid mononucleotide sulfurtransferase